MNEQQPLFYGLLMEGENKFIVGESRKKVLAMAKSIWFDSRYIIVNELEFNGIAQDQIQRGKKMHLIVTTTTSPIRPNPVRQYNAEDTQSTSYIEVDAQADPNPNPA
jgi:hypothetical protein